VARPGRTASRPRVAVRLALAVGVMLLLAACGSTRSGVTGQDTAATVTGPVTGTTPTTTTYRATVTTPAAVAPMVRAGGDSDATALSTQESFLGIATELSTVTTLSGTPSDPDTAFANLLSNLSVGAPVLLRLGGDSTDWDWWQVPGVKTPPAIQYTMTPAWGADVKSLLTATGAKAMLGVNLELDNERVSAYEVQQYEKYLSPQLIYGFALGNEPELYSVFSYYREANGTGVIGRPRATWDVGAYTKDFTSMSRAIPKGDVLIGPESGGPGFLSQLGPMLAELPSRLALATVHAYPLKHCSPSSHPTVSDFFEPASIQGLADSIHTDVQAAAAHGKRLRVDEIGGITCGGYAGVSNSFAEALWALNVLPELWKAGVSGVNFQDVKHNLNQVFTPVQSSSGAWNVSAQPEYYGLLAFADAAPAGSHLLKLTFPDYPSFYAYGVDAPNGTHTVVLTDVGSSARTVGVTVAGGAGPGTVSLLTAASLTSTAQPTLGGETLSTATGQLTGKSSYTLVRSNAKGVYEVRIPAHSAAILTVGS
jgi:hypothetical protein